MIRERDYVVFINRVPTSRILADVMDFDAFIAAGYRVLLLDLSYYYYPETRAGYEAGSPGYIFDAPWVIKCLSPGPALAVIRQYADRAWFFLLHHSYTPNTDEAWLFRTFKKHGCAYAIKDIDNLPVMSNVGFGERFSFPRYVMNVIKRNLHSLTDLDLPKRAWQLLATITMANMIKHNIVFPSPAYTFSAGAISRSLLRKLYPASRTVSIPSVDYYRYRQIVSAGTRAADLPAFPYIAYIDQCPYGGPDSKLLGFHVIDKDVFLTKINRFFDAMERLTGRKVVIAASLKYRYKGNEFGGRPIYYGRTGELCYFADSVVAHNSTAVTLPIIMRRPILFLHIGDFAEFIIQETRLLADTLGKAVLDCDEPLDQDRLADLLRIDESRYAAFVRDYIAEEPFSDSIGTIIARSLREEEPRTEAVT